MAIGSGTNRLSRSPRQIAKPLTIDGVRGQTKVLKLVAKYLIKAVNKIAVRCSLCIGDDPDNQMLVRRCDVL